LARRSCANFPTDLIERHAASTDAPGIIKLLQSKSSSVWNQSTSPIVLDIKDRAIAGHKRVEIRNAKREAADRASFDLDVDRWLRRSLQTLVDDHVEHGNDQSIAEVVLAPDRCHQRDTSDDDLFGSSSAIRYGYWLLSRRD